MCHQVQNVVKGFDLKVKHMELTEDCDVKGLEPVCKLNEIEKLMIWNHEFI